PVAVAEVDEDDATVVARPGDPTRQDDRPPRVVGAQGAAHVRPAAGKGEVVGHASPPSVGPSRRWRSYSSSIHRRPPCGVTSWTSTPSCMRPRVIVPLS